MKRLLATLLIAAGASLASTVALANVSSITVGFAADGGNTSLTANGIYINGYSVVGVPGPVGPAGSGGWVTALDCDLTSCADLGGSNYASLPDAGCTLTLNVNTANDGGTTGTDGGGTPYQLCGLAAGVAFAPQDGGSNFTIYGSYGVSAATQYPGTISGTTFTGQIFFIPLAEICSTCDYTTQWRVYTNIDSANLGVGSGVSVGGGIWSPGNATSTNPNYFYGGAEAGTVSFWKSYVSFNIYNASAQSEASGASYALPFNYEVAGWFPFGLVNPTSIAMLGPAYSSGWNDTLLVPGTSYFISSGTTAYGVSPIYTWSSYWGASADSNAGFSANITRIRVDYHR